MRVHPRRKLVNFWKKHKHAERPLRRWFQVTKTAQWRTFADVRQCFRSVDKWRHFTIFDIGGNKYRLIAEIDFSLSKVGIRHVLTHAEYDKGAWKRNS